ncbi:hypothetical protein SUDANB21_03976 [Streptomyces sp. enrichment culture]
MSKKTGMSVPDLMKIFWFNRLAARVFTTDPDGWLIKGGQALLVRYRGRARLSQDIDLQCTHPERSAEEARDLVVKAAALDLGDYLRYVPGKFEEHSDEGRGGAQYFEVFLGAGLVSTIKVDLVVGRELIGVPEVRTLRSAVDLEWPVDWPDVRLYPVIDHIADKVCAMYERHGQNGEHGSNRYRIYSQGTGLQPGGEANLRFALTSEAVALSILVSVSSRSSTRSGDLLAGRA